MSTKSSHGSVKSKTLETPPSTSVFLGPGTSVEARKRRRDAVGRRLATWAAACTAEKLAEACQAVLTARTRIIEADWVSFTAEHDRLAESLESAEETDHDAIYLTMAENYQVAMVALAERSEAITKAAEREALQQILGDTAANGTNAAASQPEMPEPIVVDGSSSSDDGQPQSHRTPKRITRAPQSAETTASTISWYDMAENGGNNGASSSSLPAVTNSGIRGGSSNVAAPIASGNNMAAPIATGGRMAATGDPIPDRNGFADGLTAISPTQYWDIGANQIQITKFDGNPSNWTTFRDMFKRMRFRTRIERFIKLNQMLEGEALRVIAGYTVSEDNLEPAWTSLCERYNNTVAIVDAHIDRFLRVPSLQTESAAGLHRLVDETNSMQRALDAMNVPCRGFDALVSRLIITRLDATTKRDWDRENGTNELKPLIKLIQFLTVRASSLDVPQWGVKKTDPRGPAARGQPQQGQPKNPRTFVATGSTTSGCPCCQQEHAIGKCSAFKQMSAKLRTEKVKIWRLCFLCLSREHNSAQCTGPLCGCGHRHHLLLCYRKGMPAPAETSESSPAALQTNASEVSAVLLATAMVTIGAKDGSLYRLRALCDNGSQVNLITEEAVQRLRLQRTTANIAITGVGGNPALSTRGLVTVTLRPAFDSRFELSVNFLVVQRITSEMPALQLDRKKWPHLDRLDPLADPDFHHPSEIDLLLGVEIWGSIVIDGLEPSRDGGPTGQLTKLGWVIFGRTVTATSLCLRSRVFVVQTRQLDPVDKLLQRFWEVEEPMRLSKRSKDEEFVEDLFVRTTQRTEEGRYIVRIPFREPTPELGESYQMALKRFASVERKMAKDPEFAAKYRAEIQSYLDLGQMEEVPEGIEVKCYIPHHAVSTSGKHRVVFDCSAATSNGRSLNSLQVLGRNLIIELPMVLIRFRVFRIALSADIAKMYRQVMVPEDQRCYLVILWRDLPSQSLRKLWARCQLFGLLSAPTSCYRTVEDIGERLKSSNPIAAKIIKKNRYADDKAAGADTVEEAIQTAELLSRGLAEGCFELCKWRSNSKAVLRCLADTSTDPKKVVFFDEGEATSLLGMQWYPNEDIFAFKVNMPDDLSQPTKRLVSSVIASLYDPNGYLAPSIIIGKMLLQDLWRRGLDWDEELQGPELAIWNSYVNELKHLERVQVPRWLGTFSKDKVQLHGFCDASQRGYGSVYYIRTADGRTSLITAKTKVAPVKVQSIPRLELCAAALMVSMLEALIEAFDGAVEYIFLWSDSTVTLQWIQKDSMTLKTFVGNRVAEIQRISEATMAQWRHVPGESNPADLASRGVQPSELPEAEIWWNGPAWLQRPPHDWPHLEVHISSSERTDLENEVKPAVCAVNVIEEPPIVSRGANLMDRYSSLYIIERITGLCLRFIRNMQAKRRERLASGRPFPPEGPLVQLPVAIKLSEEEMASARAVWIRYHQTRYFAKEIRSCQQQTDLPKESKLLGLEPYIDHVGILRVNSRLANAPSLSMDETNPMIISSGSRLAELLLMRIHLRTLHGGVQLVMAVLRQRYWLIGQRRAVKTIIGRCIRCRRCKPRTAQQLLGQLPAARVSPGRAFHAIGIDYCGPFFIKERKGRCRINSKGWVAVIICQATRAVHLDIVSELTTAAFMAAFRRFCGRRGTPKLISTDNGTTFVGADNYLREIAESLRAASADSLFAVEEIVWRFIPPGAPHQGGLWEAAVKSAKHHLTRVAGGRWLTFEEMSTVLVDIEACLNSRPLTPLSDDPRDLLALTPGHFLIGQPIVQLQGTRLLHIPEGRLDRWRLLERIQQDFWQRWQEEYLTTLTHRTKWRTASRNLEVGELVLIMNELTPPTRWAMGRVSQVHPGADGRVRVATVRHQFGTLVRPVQKLVPLPVDPPAAIEEPQRDLPPEDELEANGGN